MRNYNRLRTTFSDYPGKDKVSSQNIAGRKVKEARFAKNPIMTQEELSVRLQVYGWSIDRFGISKIERGERKITDKELLLLSKALDVPVDWLLSD